MQKNFSLITSLTLVILAGLPGTRLIAQSVCFPAPRLLTTMPMGGRAGTQFDVTITGEELDGTSDLLFSDPRLTAVPKLGSNGQPEANRYTVSIAADTPVGVYESRVMSRLGSSSSRAFSVGSLNEVVREKPNTTLATALELSLDSICNATMTARSIDHYSFTGNKGDRIVIDCAARGIDSKLYPVLILADANGRDLVVERRGGVIDTVLPTDGKYFVKVHELTFQGGSEFFYRLALQKVIGDQIPPRLPSTLAVRAFSWPPVGASSAATATEHEPNNKTANAQEISLPCDIAGSFYPAADVDTFEFSAKKGEVWWIELASERLGFPTDPSGLVQNVAGQGTSEKVTDVLELTDIASPLKPSTNHYSYDGPPYDGGSSDFMAKLEIKEDGRHRLQIRDLFGATRNDPRNAYRLIIRKESPDFALVAWGLHMELRNGDRNALSKPIALRGGATIALEVVAMRRDGFAGEIELEMSGLPAGIKAGGLKIPSGKSRGIMLLTADENAPRGLSNAQFIGRSIINGETVVRPCRLASMAWPVRDAWGEIPSPRLLADVPVSVGGSEQAPFSFAAAEQKVWEVKVGEKLTIPLIHTRRSDFSGNTTQLATFGAGFEQVPKFDIQLTADKSQVVLDLAALRTQPGDYRIAFYGSAVAKFRHNPEGVRLAELVHKKAEQDAQSLAAEAKRLADEAQIAPPERKADADKAAAALAEKHKAAVAVQDEAAKKLKSAIDVARPKDIVDIIVSQPIEIRVQPAEAK